MFIFKVNVLPVSGCNIVEPLPYMYKCESRVHVGST